MVELEIVGGKVCSTKNNCAVECCNYFLLMFCSMNETCLKHRHHPPDSEYDDTPVLLGASNIIMSKKATGF